VPVNCISSFLCTIQLSLFVPFCFHSLSISLCIFVYFRSTTQRSTTCRVRVRSTTERSSRRLCSLYIVRLCCGGEKGTFLFWCVRAVCVVKIRTIKCMKGRVSMSFPPDGKYSESIFVYGNFLSFCRSVGYCILNHF
jgi:hypothetical protein